MIYRISKYIISHTKSSIIALAVTSVAAWIYSCSRRVPVLQCMSGMIRAFSWFLNQNPIKPLQLPALMNTIFLKSLFLLSCADWPAPFPIRANWEWLIHLGKGNRTFVLNLLRTLMTWLNKVYEMCLCATNFLFHSSKILVLSLKYSFSLRIDLNVSLRLIVSPFSFLLY